jgi:hypothetical protein
MPHVRQSVPEYGTHKTVIARYRTQSGPESGIYKTVRTRRSRGFIRRLPPPSPARFDARESEGGREKKRGRERGRNGEIEREREKERKIERAGEKCREK